VVYFLALIDFVLSLVMLFPVKDERGRYRTFPYMTVTLIIFNVAIHVLFVWLLPTRLGQPATEALQESLMHLPTAILEGEGLGALTLISSAFLHANWSHLLGNMFFLFFFGRKLEDVLGPMKMVLFYLVCALVSGVVSVVGNAALPYTQGEIPSLGASGAVMGLLGAYLFLYHEQQIHLIVVLGLLPIPATTRMPVWGFMVYTISRDFVRGWLERIFEAQGYIYSMIGFFAHLGGVMAGLICIYFFLPAAMLHYRHRPRRTSRGLFDG